MLPNGSININSVPSSFTPLLKGAFTYSKPFINFICFSTVNRFFSEFHNKKWDLSRSEKVTIFFDKILYKYLILI